MKKILCFMLLTLSFAGSAFATSIATTTGAQSFKGGADATLAAAAPTPLIKFSTGVFGRVNYTADATAKTSGGYLVATRHSNGSKNFGTSNVLTNIFWKQATVPSAKTDAAVATALATDMGDLDETGSTFAANGWTSY